MPDLSLYYYFCSFDIVHLRKGVLPLHTLDLRRAVCGSYAVLRHRQISNLWQVVILISGACHTIDAYYLALHKVQINKNIIT